VQSTEDGVEQARAGVVEVLPQKHTDDRRQHHRQVDRQPEVALEVPEFVEQDRDRERNQVTEDQRQAGELDRVPPGGDEQRIVEDALVVVEADPDRVGHQVVLLEAQDDAAQHRPPGEQREAHQRGGEERVGERVVADLPPTSGALVRQNRHYVRHLLVFSVAAARAGAAATFPVIWAVRTESG
jgi:hypothetical protein